MPAEIPQIFDYSDYRQFLKELYVVRKQMRAGYSYRRFATDLGFQPSNHLYLITQGKRGLSREGIEKIKKHLSWTSQQKRYFESLVFLAQSTSAAEIRNHRNTLDKILGKRRQTLYPDQYAYFSAWYIPIIREVITLKGIAPRLITIAKRLRPAITISQVKHALDVLARLDLIVKIGSAWKQKSPHLTTSPEVTSEMVYRYHKEMIKLSRAALELPGDTRDISAMTMSLSLQQFRWLKQRLIDFRDEIEQDLQDMKDVPDLVAQLNIQFFSVTA